MHIPQMKIKNMSYVLNKKNDYNTPREMTKEEVRKSLEKQYPEEKISDNAITEQNSSRQRYFPPELEAIFSRMRNSILTNDKKI